MVNTSQRIAIKSNQRLILGACGVFSLLALGITCLITVAQIGFKPQNITQLFSNSYMHHVLIITLKQAALSVFFATLIGIIGALAFYRRPHLIARRWLLLICFSAMIMPTTVASVALLKLWGQSGLIASSPLAFLIPDRLGLWSVIIAHCFFNAPLVMRVCLSALEAMPKSQLRQAALLQFTPWQYFRLTDWPAMRAVLPSVMGLVFLLCVTSFALVLMLGGGPKVTTLEVSIYTALRFEFDLSKAAILSVVQLVICLGILAIFRPSDNSASPLSTQSGSDVIRADTHKKSAYLIDYIAIITILILNILPFLLLIFQSDITGGLSLLTQSRLYNALYHSTTLAIGSACLAVMMTFLLGYFAHEIRLRKWGVLSHIVDITHSLFLIIPALVLGTALFLLIRPYGDVTSYGYWLLLLGNSLLALPFCYRIIAPALLSHLSSTDHLSALLHMPARTRIFMVILPSLRREIGFAMGLSAALSFGDLGIITLFGSQDFETLPFMLFQFMNRYGADEADFLALLLLSSAIALYWFFNKMITIWGAHVAR